MVDISDLYIAYVKFLPYYFNKTKTISYIGRIKKKIRHTLKKNTGPNSKL